MQNTRSGGRQLCGKHGAKVPGCGKDGVWWKTRGLVGNMESKWKAQDLSKKQGVECFFCCCCFVLFYSCYFIFRSKTFAWKKEKKKHSNANVS